MSESDAIVMGVVRGEKNHAGLGCGENERRVDDKREDHGDRRFSSGAPMEQGNWPINI